MIIKMCKNCKYWLEDMPDSEDREFRVCTRQHEGRAMIKAGCMLGDLASIYTYLASGED